MLWPVLVVQLAIIAVSTGVRLSLLVSAPVGGAVLVPSEMHANSMLFFHQDLPVAVLVAVCCAVLWFWLCRFAVPRFELPRWTSGRAGTALVALLALALCWAAGVYAHLGHDLAGDEFMAAFQARIFAAGWLLAPLDPEWASFARVLQPYFVHVDEVRGLWASAYRPGHALLRAVALLAGAEPLLNPVLAAGSVLLLAHIARRIFPDRPAAPLLAAALLPASPQFVLMAGSGFSFTAHLFFALLWLALFLRSDLRGHAGAALVGAFAIGLHQVHVHPLFAAPFLLAHLFGHYGRSPASLGLYALAYGLAIPAWIAWPEIATAIQTGDFSVLPHTLGETAYLRNYAEFARARQQVWAGIILHEMPVNLLRFAAWISPALVMLALMALRGLRDLPLTVRLAGLGFLLMVVAHAVLMPFQIQGWGYRYVHPVLGNLVLLAVAGLPQAGVDRARAGLATGVLLGVSMLVLMPWRFAQVEERIRPRAEAGAFIASLDADIVLVEADVVWFGDDLVRNDPLLRNRPLVMAAPLLTATQRTALEGQRVVVVGPAELAPFGIGSGTWAEPIRQPPESRPADVSAR